MMLTGAFQNFIMVGLGARTASLADSTIMQESLSNIRTVVSFNLKDRRCAAYELHLKSEDGGFILKSILIGIAHGLMVFNNFGVLALAFWYGSALIQDGKADLRDVLISTLAVVMGAIGAGRAAGYLSNVTDAQTSAQRVFSIIDRVPGIDPDSTHTQLSSTGNSECSVELRRVNFVYPAQPNISVLNDVEILIPAGSQLGLIGKTGCGKSTIVSLLARFYDPSSGSVLVNDINLAEMNLREWRSRISIVLQEPNLFSGSVRDNIRYSKLDATDEEVEDAARFAQIHDTK